MHYTTCCYGIPVSLIQTIVFSTATPKSIFSLYFDSSLFCLNICGALQPPFLQLFFVTSQDQNLSWTLVHGWARIHTNVCIYWQMPKYEHECIEIKSGKHTHIHTYIYTLFFSTRCPSTHLSNSRWDKSLWDLPPCLQTASHTVPIHLSLDKQQCKNNMAALKKAPGGTETRQPKALLFISNGTPT